MPSLTTSHQDRSPAALIKLQQGIRFRYHGCSTKGFGHCDRERLFEEGLRKLGRVFDFLPQQHSRSTASEPTHAALSCMGRGSTQNSRNRSSITGWRYGISSHRSSKISFMLHGEYSTSGTTVPKRCVRVRPFKWSIERRHMVAYQSIRQGNCINKSLFIPNSGSG